jgi:hypothetical protein
MRFENDGQNTPGETTHDSGSLFFQTDEQVQNNKQKTKNFDTYSNIPIYLPEKRRRALGFYSQS